MKKNVNSISSDVMSQIKGGKIAMRPRAYFTALAALSFGVVVASSIVLAYLLNIVFLWMRIEMADTMAWGARANLDARLANFPWWIIPVAILLFTLAVWLTKKHGRLYRHKTSSIVLVLIAVILMLGTSFYFINSPMLHSSPRNLNDRSRPDPNWQRSNF